MGSLKTWAVRMVLIWNQTDSGMWKILSVKKFESWCINWKNTSFLSFFFFWLHHMACGTLVPQPGMEAVPPAVEAWSLNY